MSNRRKRRPASRYLIADEGPEAVIPFGSASPRSTATLPIRFRESATTTEPATLTIAEATGAKMKATGSPRRYRARLIEGDRWGSSGYYPAKVLERDGPTAWPAGTLMYLDHPTVSEQAERPERSVRDLAATITSTPVYEGDGLYAEIEVMPHAAALVESLADTVGLSVRGEGTAQYGTVGGRSGLVIESLDHGYSVDFVTRAGAGGALVSLLEAARGVKVTEARSVGVWIESRLHLALTELADDMYGQGRLTRPERITLSNAIGDGLQAWTARVEADAPQLFTRDLYEDPEPDGDETTAVSEAATDDIRRVLCDLVYDSYGAPDTYIWVRDFDPDRHLLWFDLSPDEDGDQATYEQGYAIGDNGQYSLTGDRTEVVARTVYQPVTPATEEVAEAQKPPASEPVTVQEGAPPTAPTTTREAHMGTENTGTTPGSGPETGAQAPRVVLGEAERLSQLLAESRTALAEANSRADKAEARAAAAEKRATLAEAQRAAERVVRTKLAETDLKPVSHPAVIAAVCDSLELTEAGKVDQTKLDEAITAEVQAERTRVAQLLEAHGVGTVAGLGGQQGSNELTDEDFDRQLTEAMASIGLSESEAKTAARGRR